MSVKSKSRSEFAVEKNEAWVGPFNGPAFQSHSNLFIVNLSFSSFSYGIRTQNSPHPFTFYYGMLDLSAYSFFTTLGLLPLVALHLTTFFYVRIPPLLSTYFDTSPLNSISISIFFFYLCSFCSPCYKNQSIGTIFF